MPVDLTDYPAWKALVEVHPGYRREWQAGRFPPSGVAKQIEEGNARRAEKAAKREIGKQEKPQPKGGPGTEATALLKSLGITPVGGCNCKGFAKQMDQWGVAGCREHFEQIVAHFRQYQAKYGWAAKFKAASMAAVTGLAFKLNWLDPLPDLVNEAIRRAEEKEQAALRAAATAREG